MKLPLYDYRCNDCGVERKDVWAKMDERLLNCESCSTGVMERQWNLGAAHGDEIDIYIQHGLCHPDGTPRRFRSKEELRKAEKSAGVTNYAVATDGDHYLKKWV